VIPDETWAEITLLKSVAAHYVMQASERVATQDRQRELLAELVEVLRDRGEDALDQAFAADWRGAADDAGRLRVVIDQVASLTDVSAVTWHQRLCR
jgi:dGTPase